MRFTWNFDGEIWRPSTCVQSISHQKCTCHPSTKVSWPFDELPDNNASDDGLSLSASVAVNKQISEAILMLGNDAILVAYQSNACYIILMHVTAHSAISIRVCTL